MSDETGHDPFGGQFDDDAGPTGAPSAVPEPTYAATERDGPTTTVLTGPPRAGARTSTSQPGHTSAMPARRREPAAPAPPAENDLPAPPVSWWRRRWPLAAAAMLVVAGGAVAAALLLTHGHHAEQTAARHPAVASVPPSPLATSATSAAATPTPTTVPPAELAARNLDAILMQYSTQRGDLQAAVNHVSRCQNVTAEANVVAGIAASRAAELGRLSSIDWAAMPSGPTMQADLTTALRDSRLADQDYQRWATGLEASCQPPAEGGTSFTAADTASAQAVAAKTAFLPLWRPVAARYALASRNLLATQL